MWDHNGYKYDEKLHCHSWNQGVPRLMVNTSEILPATIMFKIKF